MIYKKCSHYKTNNNTEIAETCEMSVRTVKLWLSTLEDSYIVYLMQPYHVNFGKRLTPKLYFYDPGLVCHLLKITEDGLATHPSRQGLFESLIISDILKWSHNDGMPRSLFFWKDKAGNQIECIIRFYRNKSIAVKIKAVRTVSQQFFKELTHWNTLTETKDDTYIVYEGPEKQARTSLELLSWQAMGPLLTKLL